MAVNAADAWQDSGHRPDRPSRAPRIDRARAPERPVRPRSPVPPGARPVERDRGPERGRPADYYGDESPRYSRPPVPRRPVEPGRPAGRPARDHGDGDRSPRDPAGPGGSTRSADRGLTPVAETGSGRLRGSLAVLGIFLLTLGGSAVDAVLGVGPGLVALLALVGSTALAALLVRRRDLLTVVVSPPLVFLAVVAVKTVATPGLAVTVTRFTGQLGLDLISGFVPMAGATAAGLVVALIRLAARR